MIGLKLDYASGARRGRWARWIRWMDVALSLLLIAFLVWFIFFEAPLLIQRFVWNILDG